MVIRSLGVGGAERQCSRLAVALAGRGHDVMVCTLGDGGALAAELDARRVRRFTLGHRGARDIFRSAWRLRRAVKLEAPDIIYSFMPVANLLCAWALPRSAHTRLVWGVRASWMELPEYGFMRRNVPRLERWFSSRPAAIVTNSIAGLEHHARSGFPRARMRCVENSIDVNVFAFSPEKRNRLRSEQRVPDDRRVVMLLGRIDEVKGHRTFIDAAARVSAEYRDVDFWCVGGGDVRLRESLQARAGQLGLVDRLRWLGEAKDVTAFYSAADLAVSASLSEGFPNSVAEAMACGLRVVGTDVGDTARIVVDQGMIVPPGDPEALAAAILSCLLAPAAERASVRAAFLGRFDPQQLLLRHEDALAAVAHAR